MADVEIKGAAELKRFLASFPVEIEKKESRNALRAGAKVLEQEVKAEIPVKSGDLRASARVSTGSKKDGYVYAHVKVGGNRKGDPFYAHMVHGGTKPHEIKPRRFASLFIAGLFRKLVKHPGAKANPFMKRAFDNKAGAAVEAISARLRAGIERLKAKSR